MAMMKWHNNYDIMYTRSAAAAAASLTLALALSLSALNRLTNFHFYKFAFVVPLLLGRCCRRCHCWCCRSVWARLNQHMTEMRARGNIDVPITTNQTVQS